jgi:hypothetical protein
VVGAPGKLVDLRDELRAALAYLAQLDLEAVLPRCMQVGLAAVAGGPADPPCPPQTKLRVALEEAVVGVRDFDVEAFDARFKVEVGPGAKIVLSVQDVQLALVMYGWVAGVAYQTSSSCCCCCKEDDGEQGGFTRRRRGGAGWRSTGPRRGRDF